MRVTALEGDLWHSVRNHCHTPPRHAIDRAQELRGDLRHDHKPLAVGSQAPDQTSWQRIRFGHERMERGDDGLPTVANKIQYATTPLARVKAKFMLQAHHITGAVVGRFRGGAVGVRAAVINHMDRARVVVRERIRLLNHCQRRNLLSGRQVHRVGRVLGERRESTLFGRIGRDEKWSCRIHE